MTDFALPEGTFFDCAPLHLLTTATLDRLRALYPQGRYEVRRFRPNIVVATTTAVSDFVENAWVIMVRVRVEQCDPKLVTHPPGLEN